MVSPKLPAWNLKSVSLPMIALPAMMLGGMVAQANSLAKTKPAIAAAM